MQIKNRLYPYPILNDNANLSTFFDCSFKLLFSERQEGDSFILENVRFETNSKTLEQLYDQGNIGVMCIVECSHSVVRRCYPLTNKLGKAIVLSNNDFVDKVEISMFAYAKTNLRFTSNEVIDEYKDLEFQIDKYDVIAANDGVIIFFNHIESDDNLAKSIFTIVIDENLDETSAYSADYQGKKITIYLSRPQYENYSIVYNAQQFKEVFFNMLLVPVLTEALTTIKRAVNEMDLDEICNNYQWFHSVIRRYKEVSGKDLTSDTLSEISPIAFAQELLGKPFGPSLINIITVIKNNAEVIDNE